MRPCGVQGLDVPTAEPREAQSLLPLLLSGNARHNLSRVIEVLLWPSKVSKYVTDKSLLPQLILPVCDDPELTMHICIRFTSCPGV